MKRLFAIALICLFLLASCTNSEKSGDKITKSDTAFSSGTAQTEETSLGLNMPALDDSFTERDLKGAYEEEGSTRIVFSSDGAEAEGQGVKVQGPVCRITQEGVYIVSGESDEARIEVYADDKAKVQIVLAGAVLSSDNGSVIYIDSAKKVFVTLAENTENSLTDSEEYAQNTKEDGVIFSKADLTLNGAGKLTINAKYAHGCVSKDDLVVTGGVYEVTSVKTAFSGKDCIKIADGDFTVSAGTDAFKSSNSDDADRGNIYIYGGSYEVYAESDGYNASGALMISDGSFTVQTSSGSIGAEKKQGRDDKPGEKQSTDDGKSAKALKSDRGILLSGGNFAIDSKDDAVNTKGALWISGGTFIIESGDDALHSDTDIVLESCKMNIKSCYEGIEAVNITVKSGDITVNASDDGINANGEERQEEGTLTIGGGYLIVTTGGDGLDSNGSVYVKGGTVLVSGPENNGNSALDYGAKGVVTGGYLVICGSSGMSQNFGSQSAQCSVMCNMGTQNADTRISLVDTDGNIIVSFAPSHKYSSIIFSSPGLSVGETYSVVTGGSCDADENGFTYEGTLTGGTNMGDITLTKTASTFGSGR